ncbi:HlyD family efflux transporter periplasmic adaptor subunit [Aliikangiella coralliicola]|uniref:HlyD family efflux transporter periplasmic adaptor subunit n=2 Tax=Aliikangiella coralliicola TaxID=2592383 RepID=A0A545UGX7_9GAMM|nr:HlyD family efflux transporter periplasmic adaptor subunit [Aliikangiella coralliicola]
MTVSPSISAIKDTSAQDRLLKPKRTASVKAWVFALVGMISVTLLVLLFDKVTQLFNSDLSISKRQIQIAKVEKGNLQRDVAVQGRVVAANSPTLFAPSNGTISLRVKAGEKVNQGDLLAVIDSPELKNQYEQQKNQLEELELEYERQKIQIKTALLDNQQRIEMAKVDLELAQKNIQRAELNIEMKVISQVDYETQHAELEKIKLQHKHAIQNAKLQKENYEFELKARQFQMERQKYVVADLERQVNELELTSPITGVIGSLMVDEKDSVSQNSELLTLVDLTAYEIEVSIPETYADDLGVGLATEVTLEGKSYVGELAAISPEVTNGQVSGRVKFVDSVPQGLRQNQRISSRILIESRNDVLKVRRGSFVETGGGSIAFVLEGDVAVKRPIQLGARSINEVEVISGLDVGEEIIVSSIEQFNQSQQIYLSN